jgi:hypothetical protein
LERGGKIGSRSAVRIIYISSVGRIFERVAPQDNGGNSAKDNEPGQSLWRFAGGKLITNFSWSGGADMFEISFDSNFRTAHSPVSLATKAGKRVRGEG